MHIRHHIRPQVYVLLQKSHECLNGSAIRIYNIDTVLQSSKR